MIIKKSKDLHTVPAPIEYFNGAVWLDYLSKNDGISCSVTQVTFEPKARNNWHYHSVGQVLIITQGQGYVQKKGEAKQHLSPGDIIIVHPQELHWHGATEHSIFSHTAIQLTNGVDAETIWLEAVTDHDYLS